MNTNYIPLLLALLVSLPARAADVLAEGKTKIVRSVADSDYLVMIESKDDITAGDGAKHDLLTGKASIATDTTCNVFRLLKACGIPVAFDRQLDETRFAAPGCTMILLEVVVRRAAHGSCLKRYPHLQKGHVFPQLVVEFFLKTTGKQWEGKSIPKDDPLMVFEGSKAHLYLPDVPVHAQQPFMTLDTFPCCDRRELYDQMATIAKQTFLVLEKAWQMQGGQLVDFKVEFGFDKHGKLLLADVIDNDSWRVLQQGNYIDKQAYRDGGNLNKVTQLYRRVQALTSQFSLPTQQLIIWRGSDKDAVEPFLEPWKAYLGSSVKLSVITASMHKEPVKGYMLLQKLIQETPDSVVVAFIGRSNGAGPTLAANCSVPVITVPMNWEKFPDDVWSSLRTPSGVPVMTVLEPQNALLAAFQFLGMRNPAIYAQLHLAQEGRLTNSVLF